MKLLDAIKAPFSLHFLDSKTKMGTLTGVYLPNILQMFGVILFMRLGWILSQAGLYKMVFIITLCSSILAITGLSMTSIVTNMKIGSGGTYYIISRSLGARLGSSIGILLCLAQITSIALCTSGFAVSLQDIFPSLSIEVIEVVTLVVLAGISLLSTSAASKTQMVIFVCIALALFSVITGKYEVQTNPSIVKGLPFWAAFAMFFPATTGIEAGMSMSGDLKNPSRSLPLGTMLSILTAYATYVFLAFYLHKNLSYDQMQTDTLILTKVSRIPFFVILGIWGATVSSALGSMLGAPRTIQALAKDGVFPKFLATGYGEMNLPRAATIITFSLAMVLTLLSDINHIIPMLTMICLFFYTLLNFVSFFESFMQNPSWRPSFVTPWPISLAGMGTCIIVMLLVNSQACLILFLFTTILHLLLSVKKMKNNLDDIRYSIYSFIVRFGLEKLKHIKINAKSWRPHILTISNSIDARQPLLSFSNAINRKHGFFTFSPIVPQLENVQDVTKQLNVDLDQENIHCFLQVKNSESIFYEIEHLVKNYGLGPVKPNTIILPFHDLNMDEDQLTQLLLDAYHTNKNVLLFKNVATSSTFSQVSKKIPKTIDLWWGGKYRKNLDLSLALVQLMIQSPVWRNSKIRIKSLVKSNEEKADILAKSEDYYNMVRINNLSFEPIVYQEEDFYKGIEESSKTSSHLTFIGLRIPKFDEGPLSYSLYLKDVLSKTSGLKSVVYTFAGEKMNFIRIFELKK